MPKTYIALFRGVNVGGKNALPMKQLKSVCEELGFENVATYVQSGNVVFQSPQKAVNRLLTKLGAEIMAQFGFEPHVLVLSAEELQNVMKSNPFPEAESDPKSLHVFFLDSAPKKPDLKSLDALKKPNERFKLKGKAFYLHAPDGIGKSKLAARVEKALGVPTTARNWRTVSKIQELAQERG